MYECEFLEHCDMFVLQTKITENGFFFENGIGFFHDDFFLLWCEVFWNVQRGKI